MKKTASEIPQPLFMPASLKEMQNLGWEELDILLIQGDAYIDHPAQGPALLGRWLIAHGYRVGLISQPRWQNPDQAREDLTAMGRPRLYAALSAGSMDSMLAHYTAFRKKRSDDALTPGGHSGARPNRATLVYSGLARAAFPGLPVLIGGLEASLRRLSHYDFWQDKLRRSFLLESKADLLVYGPGERPLLEAAERLKAGHSDLSGLPGTATAESAAEAARPGRVELPSHEAIESDRRLLMAATITAEKLAHNGGQTAYQISANQAVIIHPPAEVLTTAEMDRLYSLPFTRQAHPSYRLAVPALEVLSKSITTHRGCGGGCSFCSLALHQGRRISSRSADSITAEAKSLGRVKPAALSDVGASTANLWNASCRSDPARCQRPSCLWPNLCPHLKADQGQWVGLLQKIAGLPNIKQVRVASGVRYDLALRDEKALEQFLAGFVGGQLKVAPEHLDPNVLKLMRKPAPDVFQKFIRLFQKVRAGRPCYLIPYLISAFPGSDSKAMKHLAEWFQHRNWRPRQVQAFIPTPGTVATAMYYAGIDEKGQPLKVALSDRERLEQHSFLAPEKSAPAAVRKNRAACGRPRKH